MPKSKRAVQEYYSRCLKGDFRGALNWLKKNKSTDNAVGKLYNKAYRRFIEKKETIKANSEDKLVSEIIYEYRKYYREALLSPKNSEGLARQLLSQLRTILTRFNIRTDYRIKWDSMEELLKKEFKQRGFYSLWGKVAPFRSLLVWKMEKKRVFSVPLLDSRLKVQVYILDDFVELGWLHFATFGKYYVGGWAKKNRLFCVAQAYQRNFKSDAFLSSFLAHETQHLADYKLFPNLKSAELEYRAKLSELISARRPLRLIKKFSSESRPSSKFPHSFAAWQVVNGLTNPSDTNNIRRRATELLKQNSVNLKSKR